MAHDHSNSTILTHKAVTILSFVVSAYYSITYLGGRHGLGHHSFHAGNTPFTANVFFVFVYWVVTAVLQLLFLLQYYANDSQILSQAAATTWHFTVFNLLNALWAYLFARRHDYVWAEIVAIVNFINLMSLYVTHKPYSIKPLSHWMAIHLPTAALPLSWIMYVIFWNGAVAFHSHKGFFSRVLANILIWDFLIVPVMFLLLYKDWGVGMSTAFLTWGIGVGQFFTKVFALQWIFAFIIAAIVTLLSVVIAVPSLTPAAVERAREDIRSQGHGSTGETAPLLTDA